MKPAPRTWHVPKDPPPDFIVSIVFRLCEAFFIDTDINTDQFKPLAHRMPAAKCRVAR